MVNSVNPSTFPIVYSNNSSSTDLLNLLDKFTNINRIGLCFTSSDRSKPFLDRKPFFPSDIIQPYSDNILLIINIIKKYNIKNIDYLACDTLNYPSWVNYYKIISEETNVVVGASSDKTGNIKYGGDWVMESDNVNIEGIYFTTSIELYQYLLDSLVPSVPPWCTLPVDEYGSLFLVIDNMGQFMYTSSQTNDNITQVNMSTGINTTYPWFSTGLSYPIQSVIYDNNLYVANWKEDINGYITQININTPTIYVSKWYDNTAPTGSDGALGGLAMDRSTMYASDWSNGNIIQITINSDNSSNLVTNNWAPTVNLITLGGYTDNYQLSLLIYDNSMYCGGFYGIAKINMKTKMLDTNWGTTGFVDLGSSIGGMQVYGNYLYCTKLFEGTIVQLNLTDGSIITPTPWADNLNYPAGLAIYGQYIYCGQVSFPATIAQFLLPFIPQTLNVVISANNGKINLTWTNITDTTSYNVKLYQNNTVVLTDTYNTTSATNIYTVISGDTYYAVVTASPSGIEGTSPVLQTMLVVISANNGSINLTWTNITDTTSYNVNLYQNNTVVLTNTYNTTSATNIYSVKVNDSYYAVVITNTTPVIVGTSFVLQPQLIPLNANGSAIISSSYISVENNVYKIQSNGSIILYATIIGNIGGIQESKSILVTLPNFGTITDISYNNRYIVADGLVGITSITIDNYDNIFYTILSSPNTFNVYMMGYDKQLIQDVGKNINIFYSFNNLITVDSNTNTIKTYMLVETSYQFRIDISANLISSINTKNLGSINCIINNNGNLIFLFNNNTIYKLVNNIMKLIITTTINYSGIAIANNKLYGIIYNGNNLTTNILLSVYNF